MFRLFRRPKFFEKPAAGNVGTRGTTVRLVPMEPLNFGICAGAVAPGWALASPAFAASLAIGAAIEALNFRALRAGAARLFSGDLVVGKAWAMGFGVRFAFLAVAISLATSAGAHPVGLVIGLSTTIPAVVIGAWLQRPPIDPNAPAVPADDPSWDVWNPWLARERDAARDEEDSW